MDQPQLLHDHIVLFLYQYPTIVPPAMRKMDVPVAAACLPAEGVPIREPFRPLTGLSAEASSWCLPQVLRVDERSTPEQCGCRGNRPRHTYDVASIYVPGHAIQVPILRAAAKLAHASAPTRSLSVG